jgi:transcriptional regulator with XRE-family HTH domain
METKKTYTADQIKRLRTSRGLTLEDVSSATGINISTLSRIEHGMRPNAEHAYRFSLFFRQPLERFWRIGLPESAK